MSGQNNACSPVSMSDLQTAVKMQEARLDHLESVTEELKECMTTQTTILSRLSDNMIRLNVTIENMVKIDNDVQLVKNDIVELKIKQAKQEETISTFKKVLATVGAGLVSIIAKMLVG